MAINARISLLLCLYGIQTYRQSNQNRETETKGFLHWRALTGSQLGQTYRSSLDCDTIS